MTEHLFKGLFVGFAVAAPVGPIGLLVLRRSLAEGHLSGFVSGLGAALADALCASVAALGLSAVTTLIDTHHRLLQIFGGVFMIVLGIRIWRAPPPTDTAGRPIHERSLLMACLSTCLLTLANPMTILGMAGMVAATGLAREQNTFAQGSVLIGGVFLGSALWWLFLSASAGWFGRRLGPSSLHRINIAAALAILAFGFWELSAFLRR